jgi:hypothetical protein
MYSRLEVVVCQLEPTKKQRPWKETLPLAVQGLAQKKSVSMETLCPHTHQRIPFPLWEA